MSLIGTKIIAANGDALVCGTSIGGAQSFADGATNGDKLNCVVENPDGGFEIGVYRFDAQINTLTRLSVSSSSASGAPIAVVPGAVIYTGTARAFFNQVGTEATASNLTAWMASLPTSASGLNAGDWWNNLGVLTQVQ